MKKLIALVMLTMFFIYPVEKRNVIYVYDGDTFFYKGKVIRLAYIDAPEKNTKYYKQAKLKLFEMLNNKQIKIVSLSKDIYGRQVSLVYADDRLVNLEMIKSGYAKHKQLNHKLFKIFEEAEKQAMASKRGIWEYEYSCIDIIMNENPRGNDYKHLDKEYFIIKNTCNYSVRTKGLLVSNGKKIISEIPKNLEPKEYIKFVTGKGVGNENEIYLNYSYPILSNKKPLLIIMFPNRTIVSYFSRF